MFENLGMIVFQSLFIKYIKVIFFFKKLFLILIY